MPSQGPNPFRPTTIFDTRNWLKIEMLQTLTIIRLAGRKRIYGFALDNARNTIQSEATIDTFEES